MKHLRSLLFLILYAAATSVVCACDLCGCYTPQLDAASQMLSAPLLGWASGSYVAIGEQFTRFATLQLDGNEVANSVGQYLNSSITQIVAAYTINGRFALQTDVPLVYREFKRPAGAAIDRGTVSGLGDV